MEKDHRGVFSHPLWDNPFVSFFQFLLSFSLVQKKVGLKRGKGEKSLTLGWAGSEGQGI